MTPQLGAGDSYAVVNNQYNQNTSNIQYMLTAIHDPVTEWLDCVNSQYGTKIPPKGTSLVYLHVSSIVHPEDGSIAGSMNEMGCVCPTTCNSR